ncbi:MAG: glycosyltransferase family 1 protein [Rhodoferax sp.]|nr:glycosyltransferase family 1 protein [Rhodoferax sp.]
MRIALVTDAWEPQVNGVVTTLRELVRELQPLGHAVDVLHPGLFRTVPCPGYPGIDLAWRAGAALARRLDALQPDAIHIATEGPLGWAARRYCLRHGRAFSSAFHTRFPEILHAALRIPTAWTYALFRRFHAPSSAVMVPTRAVRDMLAARGFRALRDWTHGVDTRLFAFHGEPHACSRLGLLPRPVSLFVGRISYEKNIEAFLRMDIPGSKVVCGVGPLADDLQRRYPAVHWMGLLPRPVLAQVYASADVFVFPSRSETFGLVMLESMSCGTPVAAYPSDGPTEVLAHAQGGVCDTDLVQAWHRARAIARTQARARALEFGWDAAARSFVSHLVPTGSVARPGPNVTEMSSLR